MISGLPVLVHRTSAIGITGDAYRALMQRSQVAMQSVTHQLLTYTRAAQAQEVGGFQTSPASATSCNNDPSIYWWVQQKAFLSNAHPKIMCEEALVALDETSSNLPTGLSVYLAR